MGERHRQADQLKSGLMIRKSVTPRFLRKSTSNREPAVWTVVFPFARVNQAVHWET